MGITQMLQALGNNDTLENLGLHTNNLQDEGAEAIANYMAGWSCTSATITYTAWQCTLKVVGAGSVPFQHNIGFLSCT